MVRQGRMIGRNGPIHGGRLLPYLAAVLAVAPVSAALAQTPANITEQSGGMLDWLIALGLSAVVCLAGFWNPKRSHQD